MYQSELISAFKADYEIECIKRGMPEINLKSKYLALMLSKAVQDLQKKLGVIEASDTKSSISGTSEYSISASFMNPKVVKYTDYELIKATTEWIEKQYPQNGTPQYYAIKFEDRTAKLLLYPTPSVSSDTILITSNYAYALYSPSGATAQDFGSFDGSTFSGNTVFPTQYDQALLLGMMKQMFKDIQADYDKEWHLLRVKQYTGQKFTYELGEDKEQSKPLTYSKGVEVLNEDFPYKKLRYTALYDSHTVTEEYSKNFSDVVTAVDNGTRIIITSAGGEFTNKTRVYTNNSDVDCYQLTGSESTTIYIDYSGDYGEMEIFVDIYS